jgi:O-antigen ligase
MIIVSLISLAFNFPDDIWSGGNKSGFLGFSVHQNTFASALFFTMPAVILLFANKNQKLKWTFYVVIFINVLLIILSHSRAVVFALTATLIIYSVLTKSINLFLIVAFIIGLVFTLYFPVMPFNKMINNYFLKGGQNILDRRIFLWEASFQAAKKGNLLGLGYGISCPDIKTPEYAGSHYKYGIYVREKGNGILALIEETGFVGLLLFSLPFFVLFGKALRKYNSSMFQRKENLIYLSFIAGFIIHAQFEAWWVGVGSVQLPFYYITIIIEYFKIYVC